MDGMFLLDVVLNFRTGFVDDASAKPSIVMSPRFIAARYLKSYFALDLVSSLPLDYMIMTLASVRADQASILKVLAWDLFRLSPAFLRRQLLHTQEGVNTQAHHVLHFFL
jgi:hyperpolarization activated cyclic nucleotide-gated potassium channel 2